MFDDLFFHHCEWDMILFLHITNQLFDFSEDNSKEKLDNLQTTVPLFTNSSYKIVLSISIWLCCGMSWAWLLSHRPEYRLYLWTELYHSRFSQSRGKRGFVTIKKNFFRCWCRHNIAMCTLIQKINNFSTKPSLLRYRSV